MRQRLQNSRATPEQMQQQMQFANSPVALYVTIGAIVVVVPLAAP